MLTAVSVPSGALAGALGTLLEGGWARVVPGALAGSFGSISAAICFDLASRNYRWALAGLVGGMAGASGSPLNAMLIGAIGGSVSGLLILAFAKRQKGHMREDRSSD